MPSLFLNSQAGISQLLCNLYSDNLSFYMDFKHYDFQNHILILASEYVTCFSLPSLASSESLYSDRLYHLTIIHP